MAASVTLVGERDKVLILMERRARQPGARDAVAVRAASGSLSIAYGVYSHLG